MPNEKHPYFARLVEIMARLRGPDGCPWDRAQTCETLKPYLLEETYEVLEALDAQDRPAFKDELGDLLLQIVFYCQLMTESGEFTVEDVAQAICDKMTRRHPHVFGGHVVDSADEVSRNWVRIKAEENKGKPDQSVLAGIPAAAPALVQAQRLGERAARVGFDWTGVDRVLEKVQEETRELAATLRGSESSRQEHELGDLLLVLTSLARHLDLDAETSLRKASARFNARFRYIEGRLEGEREDIQHTSASRLEELWNEAKQRLG